MSFDVIRRQEATQATYDKFKGKPFDWKEAVTCVHMLRFHLVKMGHKPEPMPRIRSLIAAKRALAERGCENVADLLDKQPGLMRIAPVQMRIGDLAFRGGPDGIGGILICAGPGRMMGWFEDQECMVAMRATFDNAEAAWRV